MPETLGSKLYGMGYQGTVWVNSLSSNEPYLAHGKFSPSIQIVAGGGYEDRYGMRVEGTVELSFPTSGRIVGSVKAINPLPFRSDGSLLVELFDMTNGNIADSMRIPFVVSPGVQFQANIEFPFAMAQAGHSYKATVRRHVEGPRSGGERDVDLNAPENVNQLRSFFGLPSDYVFTSQDVFDSNYVSTIGGNDSVLGTLIPSIIPKPTPVPPPPVDPQPPVTPPIDPIPPVVPPVTPPIAPPNVLSFESFIAIQRMLTWGDTVWGWRKIAQAKTVANELKNAHFFIN